MSNSIFRIIIYSYIFSHCGSFTLFIYNSILLSNSLLELPLLVFISNKDIGIAKTFLLLASDSLTCLTIVMRHFGHW